MDAKARRVMFCREQFERHALGKRIGPAIVAAHDDAWVRERLRQKGLVAVPCDCEANDCDGWAAVPGNPPGPDEAELRAILDAIVGGTK